MIDIGNIFSEIELDLVNSLTKELSGDNWKRQRHRALLEFQKRNIAILNKYPVAEEAKRQLENAYLQAGYKTQADIKKLMASAKKTGTSFAVSDRRLLALVDQLQRDLDNAQTAAVRMMNDVFKETTAKAQVAMATNLYTMDECIDIATQDFLARGINCIQYSNGARVNIASYAEMALRTSTRRATLIAEGAMRSDWGHNLVYVTQYGACSDTCLPWQGRIYWDDVYSKGEPQPDYPRLSEAISGGLFHPNCRHKSTSWYPGISKVPPIMDEEVVRRNAALQAEQRYNERQIRKYKRMEEGSLDPANKTKYATKVRQWQARQRQLIKDNNDVLRRDYSREKINFSIPNPQAPIVSISQASEDWFDFDRASAMKEYSKTGKISSKTSGGYTWNDEEKALLIEEAKTLQAEASKSQTSYKRVFRGQVFDDAGDVREMYGVGKSVEIDSLTASATDVNIAKIYADTENFNPDGVPVIFEIENPKGVVGFDRDGTEVILPKGSTYKVAREWMEPDGTIHISLYTNTKLK